MRILFSLLLAVTLATASVAQTTDTADTSAPSSTQDSESGSDLSALIDALQDDATRDRLIEALRAVEAAEATEADPTATNEAGSATNSATAPTAESTTATDPDTATDVPAASELQGIARRTADLMAVFSDTATDRLQDLARDLDRLSSVPRALTEQRRAKILSEAPLLLATIAATIAVYRTLRAVARRVVTPPGKDAKTWVRASAVLTQSLLRALGLILAWITGYALSFAFGGAEVSLVQALYLNGFLMVGVATFFLSLFVSYDDRDVTLSAMARNEEAVIFRSVKRLSSLLIYGVVTVVPITQSWTNFLIARSLQSVIITLGAIMALFAIRRISRVMRDARLQRAADTKQAVDPEDADTLPEFVATTTETIWARIWPPLAIAYVLVAYWVAITQPAVMGETLGRATAYSAGALALLIISLRLMGASATVRLNVPKAIGGTLPTLESRLNGFAPAFAVALGLGGVIGALVLVGQGWGFVTFGARLDASLGWRLASAAMVLGGTLIFWAFISAWIDMRLSDNDPRKIVSPRTRTLLSLLRNAVTIALLAFGGVNALAELGINIAPLLAGAGVIGLAVGFGAQKLVQDIITGVFIQLENAINEGDVITVAGISGSVETLTIRSVGIRDLAGVYHLIPFSAVDTVSNFMRGFAYHVEVVGVAYDSDLGEVRAAMQDAYDTVRGGPLGIHIVDKLDMHGVVALGDSSVNVRARIKTRPGQQWGVGRAYTEAVKIALENRGVEIPYPHREIRFPDQFMDQLVQRAPQVPSLPPQDAT